MPVTKSTLSDLALLGGDPAFSEPLHVNRPNLGDRAAFVERLEGALDRRWFTNDGPLLQELEGEIAHFLGVEHCVATCNGTLGLEILCRALGLEGEVLLPSFTFVATAHALLWQGLTPVFCDVDPESWNLDPAQCEARITSRTSAIVGVHIWGRPCDTRGLEVVAYRHGLRLIYDAAHAFGCSHRGARIGTFGDAEVFSFHATKVFHTFEGGAVTTNDGDLAARIRRLRNFGFIGYDQVQELGTNAKMSEASAAMGLTNLESLGRFIEGNRQTYSGYRERLDSLPGIRVLPFREEDTPNFHYTVLDVDETVTGVSRDRLLEILHAENVVARRYFYPGCHRFEPYASRWPEAGSRLPVTEAIAQRVLVLPGGAEVTAEEVEGVCSILRLALSQPVQLREASRGPRSASSAGPPSSMPRGLGSGADIQTPSTIPRLEWRVPISPNDKDLRMLRYLLESIQEFGGPIAKAAHCVASVGEDEPPRELAAEYPWTAEHCLEFQWVDRAQFRRQRYDATGFHRFTVQSDADLVAMIDVDLLVGGDLDRVLWQAHREQTLLGFLAHVSPFEGAEHRETPSQTWWQRVFAAAELPEPELSWEHTGWSLMSGDPRHRFCPAYYNYGFIVAPRRYFEWMAQSYEAEIDIVEGVLGDNWAKSQIANTVAFARYGIPCGTLPINYNFPLHVPGDGIRALNPDPDGENGEEDIRIFHYLGQGEVNRTHFETQESLNEVLHREEMSAVGRAFQDRLRVVHDRIAAKAGGDEPRQIFSSLSPRI